MTLLSDFRQALRGLYKARGYSIAVILTLALGIGASTAMFTLLRGTLLRALPNRDGESLVYLRQSAPGAHQDNVLFSVPEITDLRAGVKSLSGVAEYSSMTFTMLTDEQPTHIQVGVISGNYFDVMGLAPVLGRVTNAHDDGPAAAPVAVLSHRFWADHFGGDPSIVGQADGARGRWRAAARRAWVGSGGRAGDVADVARVVVRRRPARSGDAGRSDCAVGRGWSGCVLVAGGAGGSGGGVACGLS